MALPLIIFIVSVISIAILAEILLILLGYIKKIPDFENKIARIKYLENEIEGKKGELDAMSIALVDAQRTIAESKGLDKEIEKKTALVLDLDKQQDEKRQELSEIIKEFDVQDAKKRKKDEELLEVNSDLLKKQTLLDESKKELAQSELEKRELDKRISSLEALESAKRKEYEIYKDNIEDQKNIKEGLEKNIIQFKKDLNELELAKDRTSKEIKQNKEDIDILTKRIEKLKNEIAFNENLKNTVTKEISDCNSDLKRSKQEITKIENASLDLEKKRNDLNEEINSITQKLHKSKDDLRRIEDENKNIISKNQEIKDEINEKKKEYARLENRIIDKDKIIKEKDDELTELKDNINDLKAESMQAEENIAQWNAKQRQAEDKWKNLDLKVVNEGNRLFNNNLDEIQLLKKFSKALEKHGFIFPERTIKAFHTSLKCSLVNPLTVLSGISGTGKSLLPELYSHFFGMNFLLVPVQPRWDSPQDLLGFYNYMEGRYKATELARFLWQFDQYNNPKAKTDHVPINMILLDEMNLARVEYYFSDMLSKLEVRNGINPSKSDQREKATIELECNAAANEKAIRKIFISKNNLFVGTMNEDESTLSLSDKVIDRSNILRFGKPKSYDVKPRKNEFIEEFYTSDRISSECFEVWSNRKEDQHRMNLFEKIITPLADALEKVDRPFGYRVRNAMKTYILNYPSENNNDIKSAIADQIEMKIIPKLNGLELEDPCFKDAKNGINAAISTTGDEELYKAFKSSCPENGTFFKWRGVMR